MAVGRVLWLRGQEGWARLRTRHPIPADECVTHLPPHPGPSPSGYNSPRPRCAVSPLPHPLRQLPSPPAEGRATGQKRAACPLPPALGSSASASGSQPWCHIKAPGELWKPASEWAPTSETQTGLVCGVAGPPASYKHACSRGRCRSAGSRGQERPPHGAAAGESSLSLAGTPVSDFSQPLQPGWRQCAH